MRTGLLATCAQIGDSYHRTIQPPPAQCTRGYETVNDAGEVSRNDWRVSHDNDSTINIVLVMTSAMDVTSAPEFRPIRSLTLVNTLVVISRIYDFHEISNFTVLTSDLLGRPYGVTGGLIKCSWCFFFFQRVISELPRPITAKLRHMIRTCVYFINWLQKFGELAPQKIGGQKHAKFRPISYNLRLWPRISPEWLKISKNGKLMFPDRFLLRSKKKVWWTLVH